MDRPILDGQALLYRVEDGSMRWESLFALAGVSKMKLVNDTRKNAEKWMRIILQNME